VFNVTGFEEKKLQLGKKNTGGGNKEDQEGNIRTNSMHVEMRLCVVGATWPQVNKESGGEKQVGSGREGDEWRGRRRSEGSTGSSI